MKQNDTIKKIKKRLRKRTIFFLILTMMANGFAWFIYSNKIDSSIDTSVRSWKINFKRGETTLTDTVNFTIDTIYPGMNNYSDSIEIANTGETSASISYEVVSVKIMDETYTNQNYTSAQLINRLQNNYPFTITFTTSANQIAQGESSNFGINLVWPYESGDDTTDTYWGKQSATFKDTHPTENQIEIRVNITATQPN